MTKLFLLGEAKGESEAKINSSFVGASGIELLRMLNEASVITFTPADNEYLSRYYNSYDPQMIEMIWNLHPEVYRSNVFQLHPPGNKMEFFCGGKEERLVGYPTLLKSKYVRAEYVGELRRLGDELLHHDPNLVLCLGNSALWAMAGTTGVSKLRGTTSTSSHTVAGYKLLPTYHPAAVLRQWELRPVTVADLMKARREMEYPEIRRPKREIWIEPTIADLEEFYDRFIQTGRLVTVDIETSGHQITCIGFAPSSSVALVVPFYDSRRKGKSYWASKEDECRAWSFARRILEAPQIYKTFQNGLYDIAFLWRSVGIRVLGAAEDTMLLHHALQPESLKSLGFMGSVYTDEGAWKSMRKSETIKRDD